MTGPLDPNNAFWAQVRKDPNFTRGWNAALWEARKLINDPKLSRAEIIESLKWITMRNR